MACVFAAAGALDLVEETTRATTQRALIRAVASTEINEIASPRAWLSGAADSDLLHEPGIA